MRCPMSWSLVCSDGTRSPVLAGTLENHLVKYTGEAEGFWLAAPSAKHVHHWTNYEVIFINIYKSVTGTLKCLWLE